VSKGALALLADDADDAPQEPPSKRAIALLEGKAEVQGEPEPHEYRYSGEAENDEGVGAFEAGLHAVTGVAGQAVAGVAGMGSLLLGRGNDSAADTVEWWKQALTYEPRTSAGKGATDVGAGALGYATAPLQKLKEFSGDSAEAAGWGPLASTAMSLAPDVILSTLGAPGMPKGAGASIVQDAATVGRTVRGATAPARDAVGRAFASDGIPPSASLNPLEAESIGAAAAVPSQLATASPELQAAVRAEARAGGVDRAALDRHLEADTLPIPVRLTEGQATQDVAQLSHEMNRRGKDPELAARFNEQNQQLIDNLDEIRREASPSVVGNDPVQNGQALIDSYKAYDEAVRADIGQRYQALRDANGGDFPVDGPAFVAEADKALKKSFKGRYVPPQVAADLEAIRTGDVAMTFEQFENLRTNLAAEARKAERSGDGNAAAAINIVRESLESLPLTGEAASLKPIADAARSAAKARFDRLRADPAYKAAAEDAVEMGEASALADDFITKYVVKGKASNVERMRETLAADPAASETIAAGALNYLKQKSGVNMYTNEGNFSQAGYNRALAELTPKLETLIGPQRAEQVQTLGNVARYTQAQPRGAFVNNSNTTVSAYAANLAKGAAERSVNAMLPGAELGTLAREKLGARADKQFVRESLKPGAGLKPRPHR
jgi:hypothetical protein